MKLIALRSAQYGLKAVLLGVCGGNQDGNFCQKGLDRKAGSQWQPHSAPLGVGREGQIEESYCVPKASGMRAKVSHQLSHYWEYSASFTCKQIVFFPNLKPSCGSAQDPICFSLVLSFWVKAGNQHSPDLNSSVFWTINPAGNNCMMQILRDKDSLFGPIVLSNKVYQAWEIKALHC